MTLSAATRAAGSAATRAAGAASAGAAAGRIIAAALIAAAAVHDALRVGQFIAKAAFQPPAQPRELRGVEAQILLLGHLDRHRLERGQEGRAAERPATCPIPAKHLGFVADADLPHLDPGPELGGQLADELAEIDPSVG